MRTRASLKFTLTCFAEHQITNTATEDGSAYRPSASHALIKSVTETLASMIVSYKYLTPLSPVN